MVASIICRSYGTSGNVKLSLRIATPEIKNAIALGIEVSKTRWLIINDILKQLSKASSRGVSIIIEDNIAAKLWEVITTIDTKYNAGTLTLQSTKETVTAILRKQIVEEQERKKAEEQALAPKKMTLMEWIEEQEEKKNGI